MGTLAAATDSDPVFAEGRSVRVWPAWAPPRAAVVAWVLLQVGVEELADRGQSPVCASDPGLWWSSRERDRVEAVEWCRSCPLLEACRSYAVAAGERDGVWGGTTPADRKSPR